MGVGSMANKPDQPTREDRLGRVRLARSIYRFIQESPVDWTVRVGVYGRWGEGKTTVLNLIEDLAEADDLVVARFAPSLASDRAQLWNQLFRSVAAGFG